MWIPDYSSSVENESEAQHIRFRAVKRSKTAFRMSARQNEGALKSDEKHGELDML